MTTYDGTQHISRHDSEFPPFSADEIRARIGGGIWGKVFFFESLDSTNERALALAGAEMPEKAAVIISESQTNGRGRLGRKWVSPPGRNLYFSVVLRPAIAPKDANFLTIIAAVSGAVALRKTTGLEIAIKWPNDLMVNGRKIGGILTELRSNSDKISLAVIGIGVNVNSEAVDFPEELRGIATSVRAETGKIFSRTGIIAGILNELEDWYKRLIREGSIPALAEWRRLSSTIGNEVRVVIGKEVVAGSAESIDDEGMLILRLRSGETRRVSSGDVMELRQA